MAERRLGAYRPSHSPKDEGRTHDVFDSSEVVYVDLKSERDMGELTPWRNARFVGPEADGDPPLTIRCRAAGQGFQIPSIDIPEGWAPVLRLEIESERETELTLLYTTHSHAEYHTSRGVRRTISAGRNVVYIKLLAGDVAGPLLVLPGNEKAKYGLYAVEVRGFEIGG
jgi:hypothetical protein